MYLRRFHLWVDKFLEGRYNNIRWFHKKWSSATCGCAGIGRLASLRCLCPNGRTGSTPVSRTIKIATPKGVAIFMVAARNFTCSAEMNSACAKVLAGGQNTCTAQKRLRPEGRLGKARDLCRMHMAKWVKDAGNKITVF